MARIENNVFLYGVAGMIGGQMVVRQTSQGGVMAVAPKPSDKQPTPAQQAQHEKFRLAVMYGKGASGLPEYQTAAQGRGLSAFNVATADFLHPPEITSIDLSGYNGKEGDAIEVRAIDDIAVKKVGIMVVGDQNAVVEQGMMAQSPNDKTLWTYAATKNAGAAHVKVIVDAADLAAQVRKESAEKDL